MEAARVFTNGGSQAVRLPKNCRFDKQEVLAHKIGNIVILVPEDDPWASMMQGMQMFTADYLKDGLEDLPVQERTEL